MADGGAAAWLPADGPGEHQSSSTPGLPAKRGPSTSAAQPVGDGGPGGYPQGPAATPSLTPGEFLLNLLQRRPQPQVEPPPPPLTLPGGGGGGAPAGPSIGGAFGPGVPVPRPGFHEFSTSPANHFPNPPPPWPDHRVFLLENWPPTTSESRPPPLPPPGFHRHERTSHIRHSPPQGRPPGFDTHLGFPAGQFDPRNSQSRHQNQPPQQLIFGSFGTPIGAQAHRLPQTTSTLSGHEQRKASDNRNSISGNSPKSHPLHSSKSHQLQGSQVFRYPNPDNLHSGRPLFPEKEPSDGRNRAPHSNGEILDRNPQIQRLEIRSVHEEHSQRREERIRDRGDELLSVELEESLTITEENSEASKSEAQSSRQKDYRSDFSRGHHVSSQRIRYRRRELRPRRDLATFTPQFIAIYQSLTPSEEETANQIRLLRSLERLVVKEWPNARLHLYGSCANSFGAPNSDIDVCLAIDHDEIDKSKILLRLAEILESNNLQDVQALTRARVPIVKMKDPETNISCDICINNILAVVNTKLLRDYSEIDARLRQLVLIIKHWAKARGVNDTYQGTLSSYAYVLMCIHFLQLRRPPVLPCLQDMQPTYEAKVDGVECAFFDRVEKLRHFGSRNRENLAELLWAFFSYWAYHHDYTNDVISVRTGGIISKHSKDWTRRVGNDRHLVCIEDPFELSHDLGRVVDKFTIKILREEFERAADIMQFDPNPAVHLFEPYVRPPPDHT